MSGDNHFVPENVLCYSLDLFRNQCILSDSKGERFFFLVYRFNMQRCIL